MTVVTRTCAQVPVFRDADTSVVCAVVTALVPLQARAHAPQRDFTMCTASLSFWKRPRSLVESTCELEQHNCPPPLLLAWKTSTRRIEAAFVRQ
eukprot:6191717-Pleurochrysis_carterae.AAC.5